MALLTQKELMEELKISRFKINELRKEGMPEIIISPRNYRYDRDAVLEWIKERSEKDKGVV